MSCIFDVNIFIGGLNVKDQIAEDCRITYEEGTSARCTFSLRPGSGVQNLAQYFERPLIVTGAKEDDQFYRLFTGVIDVADFDVLTGTTKIRATNRRKTLLNNIKDPRTIFGSGHDISLITNKDLKGFNLIQKLTEFNDKSIDYDTYNALHYTSWTPKASADITYTNSDVLRRQPSLTLVNRGNIINKINLKVNYQFKRLHFMSLTYAWRAPYTDSAQDVGFSALVMRRGYSLTRKDAIEAAIEGTGWQLRKPILYKGLPPANWYDGILWLGDLKSESTVAERDENGNAITDSDGNRVYRVNSKAALNTNTIHASSADFTLTDRWSQDAVKQYNLVVEANTSQSIFNTVDKTMEFNISNKYDTKQWDDYQGYTAQFNANGTILDLNVSQTHEELGQEPAANNNIQAAIDKARVAILKSHRQNSVVAQVKFTPEIQPYHTVHLNTDKIDVKGKVRRYTHIIPLRGKKGDIYTEIDLAFYSLGSGGTDSSRALPTITPSNGIGFPKAKPMGAWYGVDLHNNTYQRKHGFFGNRWPGEPLTSETTLSFESRPTRTTFDEEFRVDVPAIPANLIDGRTFRGSGTYNISIPSNTLTITYPEC